MFLIRDYSKLKRFINTILLEIFTFFRYLSQSYMLQSRRPGMVDLYQHCTKLFYLSSWTKFDIRYMYQHWLNFFFSICWWDRLNAANMQRCRWNNVLDRTEKWYVNAWTFIRSNACCDAVIRISHWYKVEWNPTEELKMYLFITTLCC